MYKLTVVIEGISNLLHNRVQLLTDKLSDPKLEFQKKNESSLEYERRIFPYRVNGKEKNQVVIKSEWIKSCLFESFKGEFPGDVKTNAKTFKSGVQVFEDSIMYKLYDSKKDSKKGIKTLKSKKDQILLSPIKLSDLEEHLSIVNIKKSKVPIIRPMVLFPWYAFIEMTVIHVRLKEKVVVDTLSYAGKYIGIGDWRIQLGGNFGAFRIISHKSVSVK